MVFIVKNFLPSKELDVLNAFADEAVRREWFGPGLDRGFFGYQKRYTSRFYGDRFDYPSLAYNVYERITDLLSLHGVKKSVYGKGKNGIVVSSTFDGGDVYEHRDPKEEGGLDVLRCNILSRKPVDGGVLFVGGQQILLEEGDLHCYLASDIKHFVTTVSGPRSRILWMFGYQIAKNDWLKRLVLMDPDSAQIA